MARINIKKVREDCIEMNDAWDEGAKTVEFNGFTQAEFEADIADAAASDNKIGDLKAQIKLEEKARLGKYRALNEKRKKVGRGVGGHKDFGEDSPLYGAMGFVIESERKSGLTHKKNTGGGGTQ